MVKDIQEKSNTDDSIKFIEMAFTDDYEEESQVKHIVSKD